MQNIIIIITRNKQTKKYNFVESQLKYLERLEALESTAIKSWQPMLIKNTGNENPKEQNLLVLNITWLDNNEEKERKKKRGGGGKGYARFSGNKKNPL